MPVARNFYVSSLFFLVAVTGICIFASAYDVIFQIFHPHNPGDPPDYKNLAVFAGSYFLLGLLATIFGFSRYVTVKMARQAIPKTYMPITEEDLPEKVYEFVQSELDRVARLAKKAVPLLEESGQPGWGKPESSLQNTHFKTFMASTPHFIERAAVVYSPEFARPPTMSISAYIHMLMDHRLIARDLGLEYIHGYEQARFGGGESGESQTTNIPMSAAGGYHRSYGQYRADPSMASHGGGGASMMVVSEQDVIGEDEYRRFMKLLSLILQGLSWSEAT